MAIQFTPNEFLSLGSALLTGTPITMACWFKAVNTTRFYALMATARTGNNNHKHSLEIDGTAAGDPVRAIVKAGSTAAGIAKSTAGYTANVWHHACAVFASATDRRAFLDGGNKGTNATNRTPSSINEFYLGRRQDGNYFDGQIAEAAVWNVALQADEVAALGKGFRPSLVHPASIVEYYPCTRWPNSTTALNGVKGNNLSGTLTGHTDHPRIIG